MGIPYVVITDIDTVDANDARKACPADTPGAQTSNASLRHYFAKNLRDEIISMNESEQILQNDRCYISFQRPVEVALEDGEYEMHGRTLEETFIFENLTLFQEEKLEVGLNVVQLQKADDIKKNVYERIRDSNFKKTTFALDMLLCSHAWTTPVYIKNGLFWLSKRLLPPVPVMSEPTKAALLESNAI